MPPAPRISGSTSKAAASVAAGALQRVERLLLAPARGEGNARDLEQQRLIGALKAERAPTDIVPIVSP